MDLVFVSNFDGCLPPAGFFGDFPVYGDLFGGEPRQTFPDASWTRGAGSARGDAADSCGGPSRDLRRSRRPARRASRGTSLDEFVAASPAPGPLGAAVARAAGAGAEHFRDFAAQTRRFFDSPPWVRELAGSLSWRRRFEYRFRRADHINVLEAVAYGTLVRNLAATSPESRPVILTDSRVVLGAASKGRSSSTALNVPLRSLLPYVLGGDLYPGGIHVSTDLNPADGPSRGHPVPPPSVGRPAWLDDLVRGSTRRFDAVLAGCAAPRALGFWIRLLLLAGVRGDAVDIH